jgi:hypothetical protein
VHWWNFGECYPHCSCVASLGQKVNASSWKSEHARNTKELRIRVGCWYTKLLYIAERILCVCHRMSFLTSVVHAITHLEHTLANSFSQTHSHWRKKAEFLSRPSLPLTFFVGDRRSNLRFLRQSGRLIMTESLIAGIYVERVKRRLFKWGTHALGLIDRKGWGWKRVSFLFGCIEAALLCVST